MTASIQRKLPSSLIAVGLAFSATLSSFAVTAQPAQAAAAHSGYSAALAAPLAAPRREIIGGMLWKCEADRCTAAGDGSRTVLLCGRVARKFGTVSRFTAPEGDLSNDDLARCNGTA